MSQKKKTNAPTLADQVKINASGKYGVAPSTTTLGFPDGSYAALAHWMHGTLRSAFIVEPYAENTTFELFEYGRSQPVAGGSVNAMRVHTNIPRRGENGLPKDWEMQAERWSATADLPLDAEVIAFATNTVVLLNYNDKTCGDRQLLELLQSPQSLMDGYIEEPELLKRMCMKENLSFGAKVEVLPRALSRFREYLRSLAPAPSEKLETETMVYLSRLQGQHLAVELERLSKTFRSGREATFWVHLEGRIKRTVI
jgi:hypothetical protein